jgi:hypothetical protein
MTIAWLLEGERRRMGNIKRRKEKTIHYLTRKRETF